jgi:aminoglycoside phosphotransferase (APT) family kinase protein
MARASVYPVPASVDDITAEWLTTVLRSQPGAQPALQVTGVRAEQFAQDTGFASQLYRLHLAGSDDVPATIVAKLPAEPEVRESVTLLGGYERELRFYQRLADRVPLSAPYAYAASMASGSDDFILLLEDLQDWENGDHLTGLSIDRTRLCLRELAALHAWSLAGPNSDVPGQFPSIGGAVARDLFVPLFDAGWQVYRDKTEQSVPKSVARYAEGFTSHATAALSAMTEQHALLHGDSRADNMFFDDDRLKVVDFQFMAYGSGASDVAYLVSQSLPTSARRGYDEALVREYLDYFYSHGIGNYAFDDAWRQYRAATAYWIIIPTILLIGWDNMPQRSQNLCLTLVDRAVAAIDDIGAFEVVA